MFARSIKHLSGGCGRFFLSIGDDSLCQQLCKFAAVNIPPFQITCKFTTVSMPSFQRTCKFAAVNIPPFQSTCTCTVIQQQPFNKIHFNCIIEKSFLSENKHLPQNYNPMVNCLKFSNNQVTKHMKSMLQQCRHMCTKPPVNRSRGPKLNDEDNLAVPPSKIVKASGGKPHSGKQKKTALQRGDNIVTGYPVGEKLLVQKFKEILQEDNLYKISPVITGNVTSAINDNLLGALELQFTPLPADLEGIIHVTNRYRVGEHLPSKDIFFFEEGSVIFWNFPEGERKAVLKKVQPHCLESYDDKQVEDQSDFIAVKYTNTGCTDFVDETIIINEKGSPGSLILEKYTFSNALSQSVKLAVWEDQLVEISDACEPMSQALQLLTFKRKLLLKLLGKLYALRHKINLNSDLLDSPDFYWDRNELEKLYKKTCNYLYIPKRTKVINERIDYCQAFLMLVKELYFTNISLRIEVLIVLLIGVEVMLGDWSSVRPLKWLKRKLQDKTEEKIDSADFGCDIHLLF